ncbi:hypothetical protein H4R19_001227, partial [Coemansia spiralis]
GAEEGETGVLRAVIGELEGLVTLVGAAEAAGGGCCGAEDPDAEARVHHQTLRLVHAATAAKPGVGAREQAALADFYGMLVAGVQAAELDEKLGSAPADVSRHLRLLAARSGSRASSAADAPSYAELAATVDRVLGATGAPRAADSLAVKMPKLRSMSVAPPAAGTEDSGFNVQIVVPPGGITFIAAPDIVNGCDSSSAASLAMPAPAPAAEDRAAAPAEKEVGGFAHPLAALNANTAAGTEQPAEAAAAARQQPAGFSPYGVGLPGPEHTWVATTAAGAPGMGGPGAYGMLPMPYPPHIAMQLGYMPPHMYSMPGEPLAVSPLGIPPAVLPQSTGSPAGVDPASAVPVGTPPLDAVPTPPMLMSMPAAADPYQHAMAAAVAAAGQFMYPHMDPQTLSTAATGGSENTGSVRSADSASNRGGPSRPDSVHVPQPHQQQQPQQLVAETSPRGFVQMAGPEYPPMSPYMWGQPDHAKHMSQAMYSHIYQPPPMHPPLPPPPHQQQQQQQHYQGGQGGQGNRRRGSGGNNSNTNSSGPPRERRGNSGYNRQQRWSTASSTTNNSGQQSHARLSRGSSPATPASVPAPAAAGPVHHGQISGGDGEQSSTSHASASGWQ